jgi:hypothetical protein
MEHIMKRLYNEHELQQFINAEHPLRTRGLIVDEKDGKESVDHNAERIGAYFDLNPQTPINVQAVLKACDNMREQMHWKPEDQIAFENIYATLNPQEKQTFDSWVRPQRLINNDRNNAAILEYLKQNQRYEVNHRTLLQASADRIPAQLEWQPIPERVDTRQHVDDGSGFLRDDKNPRYRNGKLNHAYKEPGTETPKVSTPDQSGWQELCQKMLSSGPHSRQAEMLRLYTTPGKTYREIYSEMAKLKASFDKVGRI